MLEALISTMCTSIDTIGYVIGLREITNTKNRKLDKKSKVGILILAIFSGLFYSVEYTTIYSFIIYCALIITTKVMMKLDLAESTLAVSFLIFIIFISEIINSIVYMNFLTINEIRGVWYFRILSNLTFVIFLVIICKIKHIKDIYQKVIIKTNSKKVYIEIIFMILCVIVFILLTNNLIREYGFNKEYLINVGIMIIFFILLIIFLIEKNNSDKLMNEYDNLFSYIQNFEDWIEKEQLNRHEYKNQLAVLRCLTEEKKVKEKIDEILEDNIKIEGEVVQQLKGLPKGGIKGLMYYKSAIAQKNRIKLTVNVSIQRKSIFNKLSEKDIRIVCKLIGIYFDNAIEAAKETRKKEVLIEIYELKDKVNFVFSNTFRKHKNFEDRNKKGISSKGKNHGNGLYFASKLINSNKWLKQKQEIIDKYYIQQLTIQKEND